MKRGSMLGIIIALLLLASMLPVQAGGWATVRFDQDLGDVVAGEPYTIGMSVWAHDQSKTDIEEFTLIATNTETGDQIVIPAESTGVTGSYSVEVTFPEDGDWKLTAKIPPYPDFALPTLTVLSSASASDSFSDALNIEIATGSCGGPYESSSAVDLIPLGSPESVQWGQTESTLTELVAGSNVLLLKGSDGGPLACADLKGALGTNRVIVALTPIDEGESGGVAVLDASENGTSIMVYSLSLSAPARISQIDIVQEASDWRFEPASLEVEIGGMVVWNNLTSVVHTIAGESAGFIDSSVIEPGQTFVQVFDEVGTYTYICGPHQWMRGTVTVVA